ncbi:MAG TPA: methyltransferase domain-containing protein, partial [Steroidobacteraceae bacterium]|nr:methyltransferase domain-containing protein [Steroidobacteraceae bacterium]
EDVRRLRREVVSALRIAPGERVLDLGCGIGGATAPIAAVTGRTGLAAGVDISQALIEVARERSRGLAGIEFRIGDACAIPYPDDYFDVARSERVFLYLPDRLGALREMQRVVKSGGRVGVIDTDIDSTAIYSTKPALTRKMTSLVAASTPNPNSARELPALARRAGLEELQTSTFCATTPYEFFVRAMQGAVLKAAEDGRVDRAEVDEWLTEQAELHASGDFFQAWLFVLVSGRVA